MLYTDTMIVTTSPLPPIENYGWDKWNSSFGWNNMDNRGDLEAYFRALIDESLFLNMVQNTIFWRLMNRFLLIQKIQKKKE